MEKYNQDPFCTGYKYMNVSIYNIFKAMKELHNFKGYRCLNPDLPILSITGEKDPVTKGAKGLKDSISSLEKIGYKNIENIGYKNIENIVYKNMLHEVLNETGKEKVYTDLLNFINK